MIHFPMQLLFQLLSFAQYNLPKPKRFSSLVQIFFLFLNLSLFYLCTQSYESKFCKAECIFLFSSNLFPLSNFSKLESSFAIKNALKRNENLFENLRTFLFPFSVYIVWKQAIMSAIY